MKVLFLSPGLPVNHGSGGAIRSYHLYTELRQLGKVDVITCSFSDIDDDELKEFETSNNSYIGHVKIPYKKGFYLKNVPLNNELAEIIQHGNYDYIFVRYYNTAYHLGLFELSNLILDCDDYLSEMIYQELESKEKIFRAHSFGYKKFLNWFSFNILKSRYKKTIRKYVANISKCQRVIFSNKNELFENLANLIVVPNKISMPAAPKGSPRIVDVRILFVGVLNYEPNANGLDRFLSHIWPTIIKRRPNIELKIVGRGLTDYLRYRWGNIKGIKICDFIENIEDVYADVDFSIVPIYEGSGTHIKVMESLLFKKTAVISKFAHRGYQDTLLDGDSLYVAYNEVDFIRKLLNLIDSPETRNRMSVNGYENVCRHHVMIPDVPSLRTIFPINDDAMAAGIKNDL